MPRTYVPHTPGTRNYASSYTNTDVEQALASVRTGTSIREAAKEFNIPLGTLYNKVHQKHGGIAGGQTALTADEEDRLVSVLQTLSIWRCPVDNYELRVLVKSMIDKSGRVVSKFKNNLPGKDWAAAFICRHKSELSNRLTQNIKISRAHISPEDIEEYFANLTDSIKDIPASNVWNYDETNFCDDPGRKKAIHRRGLKYPERMMNFSKTSISVMFCGNAEGDILPPYTVYKAEHLYERWCAGGPKGARFNRTRSGWFDGYTFSDWFKSLFLPVAQKQSGPKLLIGDNLSSHLNEDIIQLCHANDIRFCFLPANSTHLTQPLDVAFFRPLKMAWRKILAEWKSKQKQAGGTIPKDEFPALLKQVVTTVGFDKSENLKAGFRACGISPLDKSVVLARLPSGRSQEVTNQVLNDAVMDLLKSQNEGSGEQKKRQKRTRVSVAPGKSVCTDDFADQSTAAAATGTSSGRTGTTTNTSIGDNGGASTSTGAGRKGVRKREVKRTRQSSSESSASASSSADSDSEELPVSSSSDSENVPGDATDVEPDENNNSEAETPDNSVPGLSGLKQCRERKLKVGDWVVVNFSAVKRKKLFLGRVESTNKSTYEGLFMRNSSNNDGSIFTFPTKEDRCTFEFSSITGIVDPPEPLRRGAWKFHGVNAKEW